MFMGYGYYGLDWTGLDWIGLDCIDTGIGMKDVLRSLDFTSLIFFKKKEADTFVTFP
jgi:hypothetical protein